MPNPNICAIEFIGTIFDLRIDFSSVICFSQVFMVFSSMPSIDLFAAGFE